MADFKDLSELAARRSREIAAGEEPALYMQCAAGKPVLVELKATQTTKFSLSKMKEDAEAIRQSNKSPEPSPEERDVRMAAMCIRMEALIEDLDVEELEVLADIVSSRLYGDDD
jgi:DNA-directed RNA polymerase subunit K/omega